MSEVLNSSDALKEIIYVVHYLQLGPSAHVHLAPYVIHVIVMNMLFAIFHTSL